MGATQGVNVKTGVALRQGRGKTEYQPIDSWADASAQVRTFIEANDLTASGETGPAWTGGSIRDSKGRVVATVSYNGKVWDGAPVAGSPLRLLYDPYTITREGR